MKTTLKFGVVALWAALGSTLAYAGNTGDNQGAGDYRSIFGGHVWAHGATDCDTSHAASYQAHQVDDQTYILRQNKCQSFEASFVYLLLGENQSLVVDTGAKVPRREQSLADHVQKILNRHGREGQKLLVLHSHGHSDHTAGDQALKKRKNTQIIRGKSKALKKFFKDADANGEIKIDLGGRQITAFRIPGHQEESIALYDTHTKWLLTGDTLYPGMIMIKNWDEFKSSINRLYDFSQKHQVSAIMGGHIERKSAPGDYYDIGSTYQPDEAPLDLPVSVIATVRDYLNSTDKAQAKDLGWLKLQPMNGLQKGLSSIFRAFSG